tara:strand:+ start:514 stop:900 length:387 start_codon:yes stop_codon:yes gene_type:complete
MFFVLSGILFASTVYFSRRNLIKELDQLKDVCIDLSDSIDNIDMNDSKECVFLRDPCRTFQKKLMDLKIINYIFEENVYESPRLSEDNVDDVVIDEHVDTDEDVVIDDDDTISPLQRSKSENFSKKYT